ncbi:MAG: DUF368 domain-containing protein [Planctomycetaceae bacterium]|nr:DUF368 domain-containing protein [Planctomycetaceae bacterium]
MGAADIVPGVSGGTIALVLGIYDRLIRNVRTGAGAVRHLLTGDLTGFRAKLAEVEWVWLLSLLGGVLVASTALLLVLRHLLENEAAEVTALFLARVMGVAIVAWRLIDRVDATAIAVMVAVGVVMFLLLGLRTDTEVAEGAAEVVTRSWYVFLASGAVAICAMILPGISGALILILLGKYHDVTGLLKTIPKELLKGNIDWSGLLTVVVFVLGCLIGLILFSKVLRWLLHNYHTLTMAVLCGLMVGSLRRIWPFKVDVTPYTADQTPEMVPFKHRIYENVWPTAFDGQFWASIVLIILAALLIWGLDYLSQKYAMHGTSEL